MNQDERTPLRRAVDKLRADGKIKQDKDLQKIFGKSKSTISAYLSSPKPGKDFVIEFEKKFGLSLKEFEQTADKDAIIETLQNQVIQMKLEIIESNLNEIRSNQAGVIMLLKEALCRAAFYRYGSDKKKLDSELHEINKIVGGVLK